MTLFSVILSLGTGSGIGIVYGLFFVLAQRRVFQANTPVHPALPVLNTLFRLLLLTITLAILLRIPSLDPAIVLGSMLVTFWLVILKHKALFHGWR